jgi:peptide-methionine (S)-S-oxide reductase
MRTFGWLSAIGLVGLIALTGCSVAAPLMGEGPVKPTGVGTHPGGIGLPGYKGQLIPKGRDQIAMFAMGCFWGSEGTYRKVNGVVATAVGFSGGNVANPSYELVCTGKTHHAETVLVEFDPYQVSYSQLLEVFWASHDPTTLDQQGPDVGEQYRSAIFFRSPDQQQAAIATLKKEQASLHEKIVTQVVPAGPFYLAETYHQQYAEKTGRDACPPPRRTARGVNIKG